MITITKTGYVGKKLMEVTTMITDDCYKGVNEKYCDYLIKKLDQALKCDNPIYIVWEKYMFEKNI